MFNFKSSTAVQPVIRPPACQVCLEAFDDQRHLPKILQCAHTVCEECINMLEEQGRQNNTRMPPVDRSCVYITCPVCRTITQTPRSYIRSNYQLIDVVDSMRQEASHNIVFLTCTECKGVYHEKDVNLCTKCSPISENSHAAELIEQEICLDNYALCSTCLLMFHISKKHFFIPLQPLRVEMQRQENMRRIVALQDNLHKVQRGLREKLDRSMEKWILWSETYEFNMARFQEATDSFNQKKLYDDFKKQLAKKVDHIGKLSVHVQRWSDELEKNIADTKATEPNATITTPNSAQNGNGLQNDISQHLYYFEH